MKVVKHRDKSVSVTFSPEEIGELWGLLREGRRAHVKQYVRYDGEFALSLMAEIGQGTADVAEHIGRFGN